MNVEAQRISPAPIRRSLRVKADRQKAFDTFVAGISGWWLKSHSLLSSPQRDVVIEPRAGGRWYEIGEDGGEQDWGKVLAWEAPGRVLLAWQLNAEWTYDPDFETTVEVTFTRRRRPHARRVRASRPGALRRQCRGGARRLRHRHGRRLAGAAGGVSKGGGGLIPALSH